ncbi:hypothetical protein LZ554_001302 [Drepanopeziza brunnea f. sp. 'monogermtubi']|nr:hypothetical protein LZ554_001302 [Drepanopeziza brunnea f. sp. 'monogermtubi']
METQIRPRDNDAWYLLSTGTRINNKGFRGATRRHPRPRPWNGDKVRTSRMYAKAKRPSAETAAMADIPSSAVPSEWGIANQTPIPPHLVAP